jgi:hypothetical protein
MFRAFLARLSKGRRNQSAGLDATAEEFARQ